MYTEEELKKFIRMEDGKHCVYTHSGEKINCHETHEQALAQLRAIEANKPHMETHKNADGTLGYSIDIPIIKMNEEERIVAGIVYEPDVVDAQGDSASPEEIRKAAHNFMLEAGELGIMHKEAAGPRAKIVETYINQASTFIGTQYIRKGAWVMVVKILDDELWGLVKDSKITGFSMGGTARAE